MIGENYKKGDSLSSYQPSKEICDFTECVRDDFAIGDEILNKSWVELNDMSVIDRMNRDQRTANAFVDESIQDPATAWQFRGTRSKARNKLIAMHAQITASYIIPMFMAQNEDDEEDRDFSDVMRDIIEWMVDNSSYKSSFLMTTMGMLVNPVTYMGAEYAEVFQKIKVKTDEGYSTKEIIDEVLSGFEASLSALLASFSSSDRSAISSSKSASACSFSSLALASAAALAVSASFFSFSVINLTSSLPSW